MRVSVLSSEYGIIRIINNKYSIIGRAKPTCSWLRCMYVCLYVCMYDDVIVRPVV